MQCLIIDKNKNSWVLLRRIVQLFEARWREQCSVARWKQRRLRVTLRPSFTSDFNLNSHEKTLVCGPRCRASNIVSKWNYSLHSISPSISCRWETCGAVIKTRYSSMQSICIRVRFSIWLKGISANWPKNLGSNPDWEKLNPYQLIPCWFSP